MDILQKLKSQKKDKESVLSSIFSKKEKEPEKKAGPEPDPDITPLEKPGTEEKVVFRQERVVSRPQTFHTEGLKEFDLESLKGDENAPIKAEFAQRVGSFIIEGKVDEAITALNELKEILRKK